MSNEIKPMDFVFKDRTDCPVRAIVVKGEPWFVAKDVCDALEILNISQAIESLDEDEKLTYVLHMSGQNRSMWIVSAPGLYSLVFRSRKPEAKTFKRWITHTVIPEIMRTGGFNKEKSVQEALNDPSSLRSLLLSYSETVIEQKKVIESQTKEIEAAQPAIQFTNDLQNADGLFAITETAKKLHVKPKEFTKLCRESRVLYYLNDTLVPYAEYEDSGYCKVKTDIRKDNNVAYTQTFFTAAGLIWIWNKLKLNTPRPQLPCKGLFD